MRLLHGSRSAYAAGRAACVHPIFQKSCFGTSEPGSVQKPDFLLQINSKWIVFVCNQFTEVKLISGTDRTVRLLRKIARYGSEKPVFILKIVYRVNIRLLKSLSIRECPRGAAI